MRMRVFQVPFERDAARVCPLAAYVSFSISEAEADAAKLGRVSAGGVPE